MTGIFVPKPPTSVVRLIVLHNELCRSCAQSIIVHVALSSPRDQRGESSSKSTLTKASSIIGLRTLVAYSSLPKMSTASSFMSSGTTGIKNVFLM